MQYKQGLGPSRQAQVMLWGQRRNWSPWCASCPGHPFPASLVLTLSTYSQTQDAARVPDLSQMLDTLALPLTVLGSSPSHKGSAALTPGSSVGHGDQGLNEIAHHACQAVAVSRAERTA